MKKLNLKPLRTYNVTFYYHTCGSINVKARSEEEALRLANPSELSDNLLLYNMQEDDSPSVELVED